MDPFEAVRKLLLYSGLAPRQLRKMVEEALGTVLLDEVTAPRDAPEEDLSLVDGYAINAADPVFEGGPPWVFELAEGVDPRRANEHVLRPGEAVLVDAGFPIPRGANAVLPVEGTKTEGRKVMTPRRPGQWENVLRRGSIVRAGEVLVDAGRLLDRLKIRALLELGVREIRVAARPRVAVVSVGSEFVEDRRPYNRLVVEHFLSQVGVNADHLGAVPDDVDTLSSLFRELRRSSAYDVIVTIGGTGRGRMDVTKRALLSSGEPLYAFSGVKVSPGKTSFGAAFEGLVAVGLGGPLPSTFSGTVTILLPLVSLLLGIREVRLLCHGVLETEGGGDVYRLVSVPSQGPLRVLEVLSGKGLFALVPPSQGRVLVPAFAPVVDLDHGCELPPRSAGTGRS